MGLVMRAKFTESISKKYNSMGVYSIIKKSQLKGARRLDADLGEIADGFIEFI